MVFLLELHEYLNALIIKASLTKTTLAQKSGVSIANLSRILSGDNDNPSWQTLVPLFRVLKGSMDAAADLRQEDVENMTSLVGALRQRVEDQKDIIENQQRTFNFRVQDYEKRLAEKDKVLIERQEILERQNAEMKTTCDSRMETQKNFYDERLAEHKKQLERERAQIELYRDEMSRMRKADTALSNGLVIAVIVMVISLITSLYFIMDSLNGTWGLIRY